MKNVFYMVLFIAGINVTSMAQQSPLDNVFGSNQQMIEEAVKDGLFVVRRYYQLQDTTKTEPTYFGWNNLPYFGFTYSLGMKVISGYYMDDMAARPWVYDSRYDEYRGNARYVPVISESEYRLHNDTVYLTLPFRDRIVGEITKDHICFIQDTVFRNKGFMVDTVGGVKKGWLVWAVTDKPLSEQPGQALSFLSYRAELTFEAGKESYEVRNLTTDKVISGGIYVVPDYSKIGRITFRMAGILAKSGEQWKVIRIMKSSVGGSSGGTGNANELTPINKK